MSINKWLILIGALGLSLRIALSLSIQPVLLYDSLEYHQYAEHLVKEHKYYINLLITPQGIKPGIFYSTRAPGYVFFIAGIYWLFGINPKAVLLVQAFLDCLSGILLFLISRTWLKPKYALWAFLCQQILVVYVPMLMSECFFLFTFLFGLWTLCGKRRESFFWMTLSGMSWGVMVLTKPETIIFIPAFLVALLWSNGSKLSGAKAGLAMAMMIMVIAPWLWREKQVHHRFVWITTRGGMTFFDGNYLPIDKRKVFQLSDQLSLDEAGLDRLFYQISWDYLKKHPRHYLKASLKRLRTLLDLETYNGLNRFFLMPLLEPGGAFRNMLAFLGYSFFLVSKLVMLLAVFSALLHWKRFQELFLLYALPLLILLFHFALFHGKPRYLLPAYPCFCIFFALLMEGRAKGKDEN